MRGTALTAAGALALCTLCCGASGCSFMFVRPAPPDHEQQAWVDCTSSRAAPILDVVGAAQGAASIVAVEGLSHMSVHGGGGGSDVTGLQVALGAYTLLEIASAAYGFHNTADCDRAKEQWQLRMLDPPAQPSAGCTSDLDCKHGRTCMQGRCVPSPTPL